MLRTNVTAQARGSKDKRLHVHCGIFPFSFFFFATEMTNSLFNTSSYSRIGLTKLSVVFTAFIKDKILKINVKKSSTIRIKIIYDQSV